MHSLRAERRKRKSDGGIPALRGMPPLFINGKGEKNESDLEERANGPFQGDSITDCDRNRQDEASLGHGYPQKVAQLYGLLFPQEQVKFVNRGISGNRVCDLLARYEEDFREVNPILSRSWWGSTRHGCAMRDQLPPTPPDVFCRPVRRAAAEDQKGYAPRKDHADRAVFGAGLPGEGAVAEDLNRASAKCGGWLCGMQITMCLWRTWSGRSWWATGGRCPPNFVYDSVHPTDRGHALIARAYLAQLLRGAG